MLMCSDTCNRPPQADILMVTDSEIPRPDTSIFPTIKCLHEGATLQSPVLLSPLTSSLTPPRPTY